MECSLHHRLMFAIRIVSFFLATLSLLSISSASSFSPAAPAGAGYVTVNGTLYIQGGMCAYAYAIIGSSSFLSLSLKIPWNNTSPPWESISLTVPYTAPGAQLQLAVTPDKTRLVFWGSFVPPPNTNLVTYNIPNNTWSTLTLAPGLIPTSNGTSVVIDPTTPGGGLGNLYAPDGCAATGGTPGMCLVASNQESLALLPMPGGLVPVGVTFYSFVYCTSRKTMMLYGGVASNNLSNPNLYEYSAITSTWSWLQPQGTSPGDIQRHCMVETTDGSKMLVFGGMNTSQQASSRLFILYINNLTWIEGPDVGSANARTNHVCATNGDSFVVWGGYINQNGIQVTANNTPLIYNIPNNTWVQNFEVARPPSPSPTKVTSTTTGPTPSPSSAVTPPPPIEKSSNLGAIIGGAVGVFVVIAAIGALLYKRSKRAGNSDRHPSQSKSSGDGYSASFGKKGGFLGRSNNDEDEDDRDPYSDYPATHAIQLQRTSAQHTGDRYPPSSFQSLQQLQQFQSSSLPLQPLLQHLPYRPEMQNRNTILSYRGSPGDLKSEIDPTDEMQSLGFTVSSSQPPPLPFQPRQAVMSFSPTGISQREEASKGYSPVDPYRQSTYHDAGRRILSVGSQQGSLGSLPVESPSHSTYYDGGSSIHSGAFRNADAIVASTSFNIDPRGPQQISSGYETSPAVWVAAVNASHSSGSHEAMVSQWSDDSGENGNHGSYYPPPPGQQQAAQSESELMQKRLKLMQVQHELDIEKLRLKQKSQRQLIERQLNGSG